MSSWSSKEQADGGGCGDRAPGIAERLSIRSRPPSPDLVHRCAACSRAQRAAPAYGARPQPSRQSPRCAALPRRPRATLHLRCACRSNAARRWLGVHVLLARCGSRCRGAASANWPCAHKCRCRVADKRLNSLHRRTRARPQCRRCDCASRLSGSFPGVAWLTSMAQHDARHCRLDARGCTIGQRL